MKALISLALSITFLSSAYAESFDYCNITIIHGNEKWDLVHSRGQCFGKKVPNYAMAQPLALSYFKSTILQNPSAIQSTACYQSCGQIRTWIAQNTQPKVNSFAEKKVQNIPDAQNEEKAIEKRNTLDAHTIENAKTTLGIKTQPKELPSINAASKTEAQKNTPPSEQSKIEADSSVNANVMNLSPSQNVAEHNRNAGMIRTAANDAFEKSKDQARSDFKNGEISRSEMREKMSDARKSRDEVLDSNSAQFQKLSKADKREENRQMDAGEIREKNQDKQYGGKYGGASVETTQIVNAGVKTLSSIASQVATSNATNQNGNVIYDVQQQGSAATQKKINDSQAEMLENSAKANQQLGVATVVMSAIQGSRIGSHALSLSKVSATANRSRSQTEEERSMNVASYQQAKASCSGNAACISANDNKIAQEERRAQDYNDNINRNRTLERKAQNQAIFNQGIETATTAAQAALMLAQANSLKKAAKQIRGQATADEINQPRSFTFNPGAISAAPTPETSAVTGDSGNVVADDTVASNDLGNTDLLNPNIPDPGPGGPAPGQFQASNPASGAGGGGPGMGSVGGTSAAKDDGAKPESSALTKSESGKYSAGEGTGSRFARGGNGGVGVGIDSGIGDLLKKFLPGEEDQKKDGELAFDSDRSPASDQAAVLGRNQNIFEAIHKRYQKKHNEGAIVFVGDHG